MRNPRVGEKVLRDAADVVSLAFANDPLIQWLRPTKKGRDEVREAASLRRWQVRRLQRFQLYGLLLVIHDNSNFQSTQPLGAIPKPDDDEAAIAPSVSAVALIEPINKASANPRTFGWWLRWLQYHWNELVSPVDDGAADVQRVGVMLQTHNETMTFLEKTYDLSNAYYLEVAAVHPDRQGQRFGRRLMEMVLAKLEGDTLVLECTTLENIDFYKKFGFQVIRESTLSTSKSVEGRDAVSLWAMIRMPLKTALPKGN